MRCSKSRPFGGRGAASQADCYYYCEIWMHFEWNYNLVGGIVEQEHNVQPMQIDVVQGVFIITVLSLLLRLHLHIPI